LGGGIFVGGTGVPGAPTLLLVLGVYTFSGSVLSSVGSVDSSVASVDS
jgi:hypothetical protein